jgi:hypothetical protein
VPAITITELGLSAVEFATQYSNRLLKRFKIERVKQGRKKEIKQILRRKKSQVRQ